MSVTRAPTAGAPVLRKYGHSSQLPIFLLLLLSLAAPPPSGAFAPLSWSVPLAANSGQRPSTAAAGAARSLRVFGGGKLHGSAAPFELGSSLCGVGGSFSLKNRRRAHVGMAAAGSGEAAVVSSTTNPQVCHRSFTLSSDPAHNRIEPSSGACPHCRFRDAPIVCSAHDLL